MKKVVVLIIMSVLLTLFIYITYGLKKVVSSYKYEEKELQYSYLRDEIKIKLLKKLKFRVVQKIVQYKKDMYKIIFIDYLNKETFDDYKKWISKDKKLIVYYNQFLELSDNTADDKSEQLSFPTIADFDIIKTDIDNNLFRDINSLFYCNKFFIPQDSTLFTDSKITPILKMDNKIIIAEEKYNEGKIIYISDFFLFSDYSIIKEDNAVFLTNLVEGYQNEVIIFDYVNKTKKDTFVKKEKSFLLKSSFPYILVQLILLSFVFLLAYIKRFGNPLDKNMFERRSLYNHLLAVGYFFEKSKDKSLIADILDQYFIKQLKECMKTRVLNNNEIIKEVSKRYANIISDTDIFTMASSHNIVERTIKRENFIRKIMKGR